jgi:peroxiredoxin
MKSLNIFLIFLVFSLTLCSCKTRRSTASSETSHGPAPTFSLTDINGQKLDLAAYKGKVVLLDFWATWCAPCRSEIAHFIELQDRYGPEGLQIIGVSMDDSDKPVKEFYAEHKMNYPVAMGDEKLADAYGGVLGLPVAFIIDREGHIFSKHEGETELSVFIKDVTEALKR